MAEKDEQQGDVTPEATGDETPPAAAEAASPQDGTLLSRIAGLDAKVTDLTKSSKALSEERDALKAQLAEAQKGEIDKDEALRAQLSEANAKTAEALRDATLARIESKYPESFAVLGEAAASLTSDQLAANEARLIGAQPPVETETPVPVGANPARKPGAATKAIEDMNVEELSKHLGTFSRADLGLT